MVALFGSRRVAYVAARKYWGVDLAARYQLTRAAIGPEKGWLDTLWLRTLPRSTHECGVSNSGRPL